MAQILIVDADGDRRTQLGLACLRAGHAIVIARSAAEALAWGAAAPDRLLLCAPGAAGGRGVTADPGGGCPGPGPAA